MGNSPCTKIGACFNTVRYNINCFKFECFPTGTLNTKFICTDTFYFYSCISNHFTQLYNFWFFCCIDDGCGSMGKCSCHNNIFCATNSDFIKNNFSTIESIFCLSTDIPTFDVYLCTHRFKCFKM